MLSWIGRLLGGIGLSGWLLGGLAAALVAQQVVLHNRQRALDDAVAAAQTLSARNATLTSQLDQVERLNLENLATLAELRANEARAMADVSAQLERARKAGTALTVIRMEIARDPDASQLLADRCGPLDRFLDRLPAGGGTAPTGGDEDRARRGAAPGAAAPVSGRTAGAAVTPDGRPGPRVGR
jgi:cell division protein FtsB